MFTTILKALQVMLQDYASVQWKVGTKPPTIVPAISIQVPTELKWDTGGDDVQYCNNILTIYVDSDFILDAENEVQQDFVQVHELLCESITDILRDQEIKDSNGRIIADNLCLAKTKPMQFKDKLVTTTLFFDCRYLNYSMAETLTKVSLELEMQPEN